jgi:uncharacterized protein YdhG (YjbR/CyaY superfamily)
MTVDAYLAKLPDSQRHIAEEVRNLIRSEVPEAEEYFGYGMPGYRFAGKPLIYFAAFKNHLGIYALPAAHAAFAAELVEYKQGKGSVQFPWTRALPMDLLRRMIRFNAARRQDG